DLEAGGAQGGGPPQDHHQQLDPEHEGDRGDEGDAPGGPVVRGRGDVEHEADPGRPGQQQLGPPDLPPGAVDLGGGEPEVGAEGDDDEGVDHQGHCPAVLGGDAVGPGGVGLDGLEAGVEGQAGDAEDDRAEDGDQDRPEPGQPFVAGDDPSDQGWSGEGHGRSSGQGYGRGSAVVLPHATRFTHNTDVSVLVGPVDADEVVDLVVGVDRLAGVPPEPVQDVVLHQPALDVPVVDVGDLQLAPAGRLEGRDDVVDLLVVEEEAGTHDARGRGVGFLQDGA